MSDQLKSLQTQLDVLEKQMAVLKTEKINAEKEYKRVLDESLNIRKYIDDLNKLSSVKLRVTDHAIVRYLERFGGIDTKAIADNITSYIDLEQVKTLGGNCIIKVNGIRVVIEGYTVITVTEA